MTALDVPSGQPATIDTPAPEDNRLARLSLNQKTTDTWSVPEAIAGCQRAGLPSIGLWREPIAEFGLDATVELVTKAGLRVSSLCRGRFLTALPGPERDAALADNRRAIDETAALQADCLVLVVGGMPAGSVDLAAARSLVVDTLDELVPYAQQQGVKLALEPLHPMYCADRAVLSTLGQSLDWAERYPVDTVGVVVDTFHLWWDPDITGLIARAGERIASYQVCDWITPMPADPLLARGMMGDGHIDFRLFTRAVEAAGYRGDIEVEIFNADVWAADPDEVVATMARRYLQHVLVD